jgi:uncharacterized protein (DUF2267 family)
MTHPLRLASRLPTRWPFDIMPRRHEARRPGEIIVDTNAFYRVVMRTLGIDSRSKAETATAAVLRALRDRLTPEEALQARAQLPAPLQRVWDEGDDVDRRPLRMDLAEFQARVMREAGLASAREAHWAMLGVFAALKEQLTPGEAEDVMAQLPKDLKEAWAEAQAAA